MEELPEMFQFVSTHSGIAAAPVSALGGIGMGLAIGAVALGSSQHETPRGRSAKEHPDG